MRLDSSKTRNAHVLCEHEQRRIIKSWVTCIVDDDDMNIHTCKGKNKLTITMSLFETNKTNNYNFFTKISNIMLLIGGQILSKNITCQLFDGNNPL